MASEMKFAPVGEVSILDMHSQPVHCKISCFLCQRNGGCLELSLEVVMLEVMSMAIIVLNLAELRLFKVKVKSQQGLAVGNDRLVCWVICTLLETIKQLHMFVIKSLVEGHKGLVPDKWLGDLMKQFSFV